MPPVSNMANPQARKISSGGVGVFHMKGGAKKFGMSLETREIKLYWRDIPAIFAGISRSGPKSGEKFELKIVFDF